MQENFGTFQYLHIQCRNIESFVQIWYAEIGEMKKRKYFTVYCSSYVYINFWDNTRWWQTGKSPASCFGPQPGLNFVL
jgi:hypothetical protein